MRRKPTERPVHDAVVIGLGPAGATAAYRLARLGFDVLGIDREVFPRRKPCGGCVSTKIDSIIDFDISGVVDAEVCGATFSYRMDRYLDIPSERPVGYNVRREVFDSFLVEKAALAGARVVFGKKACAIADEGGHVTVSCEGGGGYRARFVVCSDGVCGGIGRRYFGLGSSGLAVSCTAEVPFEDGGDSMGKLFIDFGLVPHGYGWIFPKRGALSVGVAGEGARAGRRIKDLFSAFVSKHRALKGVEVKKTSGFIVPLFYGQEAGPVKGRVVAVGDAGHMVDPFLGEGIYYAMRTAQAASDAIAGCLEDGTADLSPYAEWLEREIYPDFRVLAKVSRLIYNYPKIWYALLERDAGIMHRYYEVIRGERTPEAFYSWVLSRIKSKPWKVIRGLIAGRFMA